jgi:hypothetical protein
MLDARTEAAYHSGAVVVRVDRALRIGEARLDCDLGRIDRERKGRASSTWTQGVTLYDLCLRRGGGPVALR